MVLAGLFLVGCGGGGGATRLGSVALMLAGEQTDSGGATVFATFTEVALLPDGGGEPVVVFTSDVGEEVSLAEGGVLLAVTDEVPPGMYGQVRVGLTGVRFEGGECDDIVVDLPDGMITLVPASAILVGAGDTVSIRIAMDVDKSMEEGSGGCTFRPVLRLRVGDVEGTGECPQSVTAEVVEVLEGGAGGVLSTGLVFLVNEETAIFDEDGLLSDASEIVVGAQLTVKGRLNEAGPLLALVIVVGEVIAVEGRVDAPFAGGVFSLLPDEGEEIVGALNVSVVDGTLVLMECNEGSTDDIVMGTRLVVAGKFDTGAQLFHAVCVEIGPAELQGELTGIAEGAGGFDLTVQIEGEEDPRMIFVGEDVGVHLHGDGEIPFDVLSELLLCGPLPVTVFFAPDDPTLVVGVFVEEAELEGEVTELNTTTRIMAVGDAIVSVLPHATILDLEDGELEPLSDVELGDRVRVFGLEGCETQDADFHGFVVLIVPEDDEAEQEEDDECEDEEDKDDKSDEHLRDQGEDECDEEDDD